MHITDREKNISLEAKEYLQVLMRALLAAAAAPPETLWLSYQSTAPGLHCSGTHQTPGRSCLNGRWSQRGRGSWMESEGAAGALCEATQ